MYKGKERGQKYLFDELTPFGGVLKEENRWLKIRDMIPWEELEKEYAKYFSDRGRHGLDGRLVVGLFLLRCGKPPAKQVVMDRRLCRRNEI